MPCYALAETQVHTNGAQLSSFGLGPIPPAEANLTTITTHVSLTTLTYVRTTHFGGSLGDH